MVAGGVSKVVPHDVTFGMDPNTAVMEAPVKSMVVNAPSLSSKPWTPVELV
jgi:hypothetical protein